MDDQYLDAFIRESEEAITELNNSLLDLEADPEDREAMDAIFRTAHTLKGNFGAMGFEDASDLAHAIENLLDAMRQGEMSVTADRMDLIFAGVDMIEAIVREVEEHGESTTETDEMVSQLRAVMDDHEAAGEDGTGAGGESTDASGRSGADASDEGEGSAGASRASSTALSEALDVGFSVDPGDFETGVVGARLGLGDSDMLGVDAMLALEAVEEAYPLLGTDPARDAIEEGEFDGTFAVVVDAADVDAVAAEFEDAPEVESVEAEDLTGEVAGDAAATDAPAGEGGAPGGSSADAGPTAGAETPETPDAASDAGSDDSVDEIKSVRVDVDQLDDLHGLVEQLVTSRIKLRRAVEHDDLDAAGENLNELDKITANLQNTVMDMRLIPLKKVVGKFPRMVRDLSRDLDKDVEFTIEGEDIELDRTILTEISDPLMHIIRNAVDHGIESPAEREAAGKPPTGQVELRASRERDHVIIEVADDGAGLDVEGIRRKAIEQGVRSPEELEAMDQSSVYDLVFHPGFSTAEEVTDTSGRGVGMDVVHDTVTQLDGSVNVESTPGEGTTVSLRLPVTMAIVKVLFVEIGDEEYGIPLKNVDEITRTTEVKHVNGNEVIKHNDDIYPVVHLGERFDVPGVHNGGGTAEGPEADIEGNGRKEDGMLVRIRESERQVALHCDEVNSQEEVVVKPLEGILSGTPGLSGTAVLGDGNIVHILDVVTL
ncbi:chemotaxis protein CheA [Halobacteriales archaeon QH_8_68_33]|nr:MAG: chemotaxis protein CheA [Halobacteriales archaeon QH_8_68_33]